MPRNAQPPLVTNVQARSHMYGRYVLSCEHDGARYHVWCRLATKKAEDGAVLYKNPPLGLSSRYDKGYFNTRKLGLSVAKNRALYEAMLDVAERENLVQKMLDAEAANEKAAEEEWQAEVRKDRVRDAAEDLLAVVEKFISISEDYDGVIPAHEFDDLYKQALAARTKAVDGTDNNITNEETK